jgi:thiol-disulfide isomerase/thioredoxin
MLKYLGITLLCGLCFFKSNAQEKDSSYLIGDKFPEYVFNATQKDSSYQFTLSKYQGKNVIIDLWNVYCAGCIGGMKKLDSLQKIFKETLQIILVTKNSKEQVEKLFSRKNLQRPDLPIVVADTIAYDVFFPHDGDPLHVWIDTSRVIKYITGGYNTTAENIKKFMNNEPLKVSFQAKLKNYDAAKPLIDEASTRLKFYTAAYSIFTKGLHNVINTYRIEILKDKISGEPYSIKAINATALTLYQIAFNRKLYGVDLNMFQLVKNNRIILDSERADSLIMPREIDHLDPWKNSNMFCYELSLPIEKSSQIFSWMQQDLLRFFTLDVSIQKRRSPCLILINTEKGISSEHKHSMPLYGQGDCLPYAKRKQMGKTIESLIYLTQNFNLPFVDQTSIDTDLSIPLPSKVNSIDEVNRLLKNYGLMLVKEVREIDFLIIK